MVTLEKSGDSAVKFVFTDSDHYLYGDGVVEVPVNALLLTIDESEMVTFKKLSGDPFISFRADNSNLGTKAAIEQFYKDNMVGSTGGGSGSGVTPSEVQEMIDESISGKADTSDVTAVANDVSTISGQVATKVNTTDFNAYSAATDARIAEDEEVTAAALNNLDEKISTAGGLFVDFQDLIDNMNDDKWDELVDAIQNNKPIFYWYDYSEGDITDAGQSPVDGYVFIDQTEGEETTEISLRQLNGGGWYSVTIIKNGSEDYEVIDEGFDYQPMLHAGSGISIDENNVISMTVDSVLKSNSTNAVENRVIYDKVTMEVGSDTIEYDSEPVTSTTSGSRYYKVVFNDPDQVVTFTVAGLPDTIKLDGNTGQLTYTNGGALPEGVVTSFTNPAIATYEVAFGYDVTSAVVTSGGDIIYVGHKNTTTEWVKDVVGDLLETVSDKADTSAVTAAIDAAISGKVDTSAITTAITSGSTDSEIPTAKATYDAIQAGGGGGATYSAGTNISIDTANTINCTLPIYNGSGNNSLVSHIGNSSAYGVAEGNGAVAWGSSTRARGDCSIAIGATNDVKKARSITVGFQNTLEEVHESAFGHGLKLNNSCEFSSGEYNNSVTGSTASGQTLFSVGNGTSSSARHNAFEIRRNGDIYVNDGTNDVRLQDTILALGGLKLVKLTQAEYDNLATKDANTLYIISNVVS